MIHSAFIMSEVRMVAREIRSEEETWMCGKKNKKNREKENEDKGDRCGQKQSPKRGIRY